MGGGVKALGEKEYSGITMGCGERALLWRGAGTAMVLLGANLWGKVTYVFAGTPVGRAERGDEGEGGRAAFDAAPDELVLAVLEKMMKQRKDSISQYEAAGRDDLAAVEKMESAIIQGYLPQPLTQAEIEALVAKAVADTGADGPQAMGKVIAALKPLLAGRADMGAVSALVKAVLAK